MPNLLSARSRSYIGGGRAVPVDDDEGRVVSHACYGIAASAVTLVLFCALAAAVSVWMAFVFAGLALAAFAVGSCLAPATWRVGANHAETEPAAAVAAPASQRKFGLTKAAIDALPTFPYTQKGADGGDLEAGGNEMCSVCLEDVQAGNMVRQLPECKHVFHVECIDMWLHSHQTCPVCRCNLSPPRKVPGKAAATAAPAAETTVETEPPADDVVSPV
ncbi:hypothetical protein QOZ80_2AG0107830 [Eleusine coracana subsp. coracana]|nr:hypothetical protein QOZ80_2AG0107830 [Eleusine coracana subsp. coracana]